MARPKIPTSAKETAEALVSELKSRGVENYEFQPRGKHIALMFEWRGQSRSHFFPSSPSDWRHVQNQLRDLRHQLGVVGGPKQEGEPRQRKGTAPPPKRLKVPEMGAASPVRGMEQLAELFERR